MRDGLRVSGRRLLLAATLAATAALSSGCAVWRSGGLSDNSQPIGGPCERILIEAGGPEDIAVDPRGGFFISASDWRARAERETPKRGAIYRLTFDATGGHQLVDVSAAAPADFQPHGIDLWIGPDGEARLFVINHPVNGASRVEIFRVAADGTLQPAGQGGAWPELHRPNDLAAFGPASFFATNDHDVARIAWFQPNLIEQLEDITGWAGGSVIRVQDGKATTVAKGFALANGVALSPDGGRLYVAESAAGRVQVLEDLAGAKLRRAGSVRSGPGPDNLTFDAEGALWIGAHNNGLAFLRHMRDAGEPSPGRVARLAPSDAEPKVVYQSGRTLLQAEPPQGLSAVSVGVPDGRGGVLVGNIFTKAVERCPSGSAQQIAASR